MSYEVIRGNALDLPLEDESVDLSADYCRLAEWRIGQSGHFQKAWERTAAAGGSVPLTSPKDKADGRLSLFGEAS